MSSKRYTEEFKVIPLLYYTLLKRVKIAPASRPLAVAQEQTP